MQVAIVTAAGYPGEAHKFEGRLAGLLEAFRTQKLPAEITDRCPAFHWVVGWEASGYGGLGKEGQGLCKEQ